MSPSGMAQPRELRGIELRYALTMYLAQHGSHSVAELIEALTYQGFRIPGRASKAVSDALRWEIAHDRVRRHGWGRYGPGVLPRATEYRIHQRVLAMREEARGRPFDLAGWDGPTWSNA
jgi:hypothetical protein|nr:hypothetical protein [Mycobacterium sp. URHB0044]